VDKAKEDIRQLTNDPVEWSMWTRMLERIRKLTFYEEADWIA
jgi:hypothetical protein